MPACSLVRYQAIQHEASRHFARASTRGGFTGQLNAQVNLIIRTRLRSMCAVCYKEAEDLPRLDRYKEAEDLPRLDGPGMAQV